MPAVGHIQERVIATAGIIAIDVLQAHFYAVLVGKGVYVIYLSGMFISARVVDALYTIAVGIDIIDYIIVFAFEFAIVGISFETIGNGQQLIFLFKSPLIIGCQRK
ncbi:hypothetical protein SDC9_158575 [bioreactor metagenome]|uniref:Uncharacterized protein n=1 Tax=bioreactor metagenome TaxID=1076179 RepID=A0A645FFK0_9ZZZZ